VARQPVDAEAVRSSLEEFEAAVERAQRDSAEARTEALAPSKASAPAEFPEGAGQ
jgi:hypothetical protein